MSMRRVLRPLALLLGFTLALSACTLPDSGSHGQSTPASFPDWGEVETGGTPMLQPEQD